MRNSAGEGAEAALWEERLAPAELVDELSRKFPVESSAAALLDEHVSPFSTLTEKGSEQMRSLGSKIAGVLRAEGFLSEVAAPGAVKALSSSYLRTQRSAQLVMLGLEEASEGPTQVHGVVQVPPEDKDAINVWPTRHAMRDAIDELTRTELFQQREAELQPVRSRLLDAMPYLGDAGHEFVWMHAADYFMCRRSHDLPLLQGLTQDDAQQTVGQVEWRFNRWYCDQFVRAHAAGPLLSQLLAHMRLAAGHRPTELLALYSGHDVTVLPLLHALTGNDDHAWPPYAANVRLELLQPRNPLAASQLYVRVFYNDAQLRIRGCDANICTLYHFARLVQNELEAHAHL